MMDCLRACEVISAAHDGELVDVAQLEEARAHAEACAQCRAFQRLLPRLDTVPAPHASQELVERLVAMSAQAAAEARDAAADAAAPPVEPTEHGHKNERPTQWVPRFAAFAAAAAVLLIVFAAGSVILLNPGRNAEIAGDTTRSSDDGYGGAPQAATPPEVTGSAESADALKSGIAAPAYVAFDGGVWVLEEITPPAPSTLATAGVVTSSLDAVRAAEHPAYFVGTDRSVLWVRTDDGRHLAFKRVVRTLGGAEYGLSSDVDIRDFGTWPKLPARFEQPQSPDGSPTFTRFGFEDLNLDVYVPIAGRVEDGFAMAPGTPPTDPAAGNPGWTWWDRLR